MTITVPPDVTEALSLVIGNHCSFQELRVAVYKCEGNDLINTFANESWPMKRTAGECLVSTQRTGRIKLFLAFALAYFSDRSLITAPLKAIFPDLESYSLDVKAQAKSLGASLHRKPIDLDAAGAAPELASLSATVNTFIGTIKDLEIYKNLHDSLHRIQTTQFSLLRSIAKDIVTNSQKVEHLRLYQQQVHQSCVDARYWGEQIAEGDMRRAIEMRWIERLERFFDAFRDALDNPDVQKARDSIGVFWRLSEEHQPRLNGLIFATAANLPVDALVQALAAAAKAVGDAELEKICAGFLELKAALLGRVVEHSLWQDTDYQLWGLDKAFEHAALIEIDNFAIDWPVARTSVRTLSLGEREAKWSQRVARLSTSIDDGLVEVDKSLSQDGEEDKANKLKETIKKLYEDFRQEARDRFLLLDRQLKQECSSMADIGAPLQLLIRAPGHG